MVENFDPNTIEDPVVRQVVLYMMNEMESQRTQLREKDEEIQRLRDQINRLMGEQGCTPDQGKQAQRGSLIREAPSSEQASSKEQQTGETQD